MGLSLALHALVAGLVAPLLTAPIERAARPAASPPVVLLTLPREAPAPVAAPAPSPPAPPPRPPARRAKAPPPVPVPAPVPEQVAEVAAPRAPATMAAPPPPTAEEWAFAARYTLKNSKGYRHSWGQQVRSMMGTAVEGPDQGAVRFRIEIAPDGRLARLETLWSTSAAAERLARAAIDRMPAGPPTPTGQPLVFEKTIVFSPFASDGPPIYRDDCRPDPPTFKNPFAWNGRSPRVQTAAAAAPPPTDPQALADCLKQLPKDSIDAELARERRMMDQWGWTASQPGR